MAFAMPWKLHTAFPFTDVVADKPDPLFSFARRAELISFPIPNF